MKFLLVLAEEEGKYLQNTSTRILTFLETAGTSRINNAESVLNT